MNSSNKAAAILAAWQKVCAKAQHLGRSASPRDIPGGRPLLETMEFGSNPGRLRMFSYSPAANNLSALMVVLHGCGQTAASYDYGAGWSTLADRYRFALLLPEQQASNNPKTCFNWFLPEHTQRGQGEALSIRQMIDAMVRKGPIDSDRVFITGLSAGGAMTSVMLACYPEVFAGGAIIAGLPYGAAANVQQAFASMFQCPSRPARVWGDLVRAASAGHAGPWPKVSIWHGEGDTTVVPANAREIIKQWTDVHGLPLLPAEQSLVDGHPRQLWCDQFGEPVIESYAIARMGHGTPLSTYGGPEFTCGAPGPYLLEVGISSSYHIAKFFGLTATSPHRGEPRRTVEYAATPTANVVSIIEPAPGLGSNAETASSEAWQAPEPGSRPSSSIAKTITDALTAAGLMRR